jgi:hypothetical protein
MFPTADQIALAIVTACRIFGEDPIALVKGRSGTRARQIAFAALMEVFPKARRAGLGACLGFGTPRAAQGQTMTSRKLKWWNELWVDEVIGALVASEYGAQAA